VTVVRPRNPWDDEDVTPHDADICACTHRREFHQGNRCWACWIVSPQVLAPAFPDHEFHLILPFNVPVQTRREVVDYRPARGWDRP